MIGTGREDERGAEQDGEESEEEEREREREKMVVGQMDGLG
jgi:hypothetical protein